MSGCPRLGRRGLVRAGIGAGAALGAARDRGLAAEETTPDPAVPAMLPLDDLQPAVLQPRPLDYVAAYLAIRIDDPAAARGYLRQVAAAMPSVADFVGGADNVQPFGGVHLVGADLRPHAVIKDFRRRAGE